MPPLSALRFAMTALLMPNELTNLLPLERRKALARDHLLRLGVAALLCMTALTVAAALLLLPTYVLLAEKARAKQAHLTTIESTFSSTSEAALTARLTALATDTATLSMLARAPSASAIMRSVLAISHPGITLSGFTYTPAVLTSPGTLAISGTALSRDALRGYQLELSSASFARTVDLPVSAYAKDSNIEFTITVTLTP